jgi:diadenosine tetraphosphatase ApaH/serine/threonine PP2A family protein phosphatase
MREVEAGAVALLGNHDAAISTGTGGMNHCRRRPSIDAARLDKTQSEFLTRLPLTFEDGNRLFVHASANARGAGSTSSVSRAPRAASCDARASDILRPRARAAALICRRPAIADTLPVQAVEIPLPVQRRWLAVIGSVGQPRDDNPAACYGALDTERNVLIYVRVAYDNETAARKIREAGLPEFLSQRLIAGV